MTNDFSNIVKPFGEMLSRYDDRGGTWASCTIDLMRRERATGDFSYDTIHMMLLHPKLYQMLTPILSILCDPAQRHIFLQIVEDTLEKLSKGDNDGIEN